MVKRSLALSFVSSLAKIAGGIGIISLLARVFSLSDFGNFTYALTLGTVFSLIIDYGFNIKIIKDISTDSDNTNNIISIALISKLLLFLLGSLLFVIVNIFLNNPTEVIISGFFMFLSFVVYSFINSFLSVFKGKKEYHKDVRVVLLDNIITIIVVASVALYTKNIQTTAIAFFLSKIVGLIYAYHLYKKTNQLLTPSLANIKRDLYSTLPYAIHYWVGTFYLNIDTIIMKPLVSSEDLGIYQAGIRVVIGMGILLTIINSVYLPILNEALIKSKSIFKQKAIALNVNIIRVALFCGLGMFIFSKLIILILYGEKFDELNDIFWVFALIVSLRVIGSSYGILLTISDKQVLRAIAGAISIVLIVICDLLLIPIYGYKIAAFILFFAHLFITIFYMISIYLEHRTLFIPSFKFFFSLKIQS